MPPITMTLVIGAIKPDEGDLVEPQDLIFQISTPDDISDKLSLAVPPMTFWTKPKPWLMPPKQNANFYRCWKFSY